MRASPDGTAVAEEDWQFRNLPPDWLFEVARQGSTPARSPSSTYTAVASAPEAPEQFARPIYVPSLVSPMLPKELDTHRALALASPPPLALLQRLALGQRATPTRMAAAPEAAPAASPWAEFFADEKPATVRPAVYRTGGSGSAQPEPEPATLMPAGLRIEQDYDGGSRRATGNPEALLPRPLDLPPPSDPQTGIRFSGES